MREIKFRGQHIISKKWIVGDLIHEEWIGGKAIMIKRKKTAHSVLEETVGQYTGLHDKNGKEIYEGDIVGIDKDLAKAFEIYSKGIINYVNGGFVVTKNDGTYETIKSSLLALGDLNNIFRGEVIGNIYENSDLLKGADNIE